MTLQLLCPSPLGIGKKHKKTAVKGKTKLFIKCENVQDVNRKTVVRLTNSG